MSKIDKMDISEGGLFNQAAIAVFQALIMANQGTDPRPMGKLAEEAWQAAAVFMRARQIAQEAQYDRILEKYETREALRRLAGMCWRYGDNNIRADNYMAKPSPFTAFLAECDNEAIASAISRYLAKTANTTTTVSTTELDDDALF